MHSAKRIRSPRHAQGLRGFGLVELMVAVSVILIIAAIAVPALAGYSDEATTRRCQRIAQDYAMLANSAIAAGNESIGQAGSVAGVLELISQGVKGSGIFSDTEFRLPSVSISDQNNAAHHLKYKDGTLYFDPAEPS